MDPSIKICIKPDFVSWDVIHDVLWESHAENRKNGVVMRYPSLPGEEIRSHLGEKGKMLVALTTDGRLVGTAAYIPKETSYWIGKHTVAYCCFASILPEYNGKGIYREMCRIQEEMAKAEGLSIMLFDTHERNSRNIAHSMKAGYRPVDTKYYRDHFNVVMVKWLDGCPYSNLRCRSEYMFRRALHWTGHMLKRLFLGDK